MKRHLFTAEHAENAENRNKKQTFLLSIFCFAF
jgi:hypothetical protein